MGVPRLFKTLVDRYPTIVQNSSQTCVEYDHFYIDMNGLIHNCSHSNDAFDTQKEKSEIELATDLFNVIEQLFSYVRPRKLMYLAIDGVAPRAKMNQQRQRRYRQARLREKHAATNNQQDGPLTLTASFDSNAITPGTEFLDDVERQLIYFIQRKIHEDIAWRSIQVIFSGWRVAGEGEHKIMEFIRALPKTDDAPIRHCLYGLDADLILLSLATHEPHFSIIREKVEMKNQLASQHAAFLQSLTPQDLLALDDYLLTKKTEITFHSRSEYEYIHIGLLREYLAYLEFDANVDLTCQKSDIARRRLDDMVFLFSLLGNDFLPHMLSVDIDDGGFTFLMNTYKHIQQSFISNDKVSFDQQTSPPSPMFLVDAQRGQFNASFLAQIFSELSQFEMIAYQSHLSRMTSIETQEKETHSQKDDLKYNADSPIPALQSLSLDKDTSATTHSPLLDLLRSQNPTDDTLFNPTTVPDWRQQYYHEKFQTATKIDTSSSMDEQEIQRIACSYLEGLEWIFAYYYHGVPSWSWFYPHHSAPLASDLHQTLLHRLQAVKTLPLTTESTYVKGRAPVRDVHAEEEQSTVKVNFLQNRFLVPVKGTHLCEIQPATLSTPLQPFEQLLAVLPPASAALLPAALQPLMKTASAQALAVFFPVSYALLRDDRQREWRDIALIPFIDSDLLQHAVRAVLLDDAAAQRNVLVAHAALYAYAEDAPLREMASPLRVSPVDGGSVLTRCLVKTRVSQYINGQPLGEKTVIKKKVNPESLWMGTLEKLLLGFPSLFYLPVQSALFERQQLRGRSKPSTERLTLRLDVRHVVDQQQHQTLGNVLQGVPESMRLQATLAQLAHQWLGKRCRVGCVYVDEGRLVAIESLSLRKVFRTSQRHRLLCEDVPQEDKETTTLGQRLREDYQRRYGVDVGPVHTVLHVQRITGMRVLRDGSTVVRYDEDASDGCNASMHPSIYPLQCLLDTSCPLMARMHASVPSVEEEERVWQEMQQRLKGMVSVSEEEEENTVSFPDHRSLPSRFIEHLHPQQAWRIHDAVVCLSPELYGATGRIVRSIPQEHAEKKNTPPPFSSLEVALTASLTPKELLAYSTRMTPSLNSKTAMSSHWMTATAAAQSLGCSALVLSRMAGWVVVQREDGWLVEVGLNIKSERKRLGTVGYCQKVPVSSRKNESVGNHGAMQRTVWMYSQRAVTVLSQLAEAFPDFVRGLEKSPSEDIYPLSFLFLEEEEEKKEEEKRMNDYARLRALIEWLNQCETARLPLLPTESESMEITTISQLECAMQQTVSQRDRAGKVSLLKESDVVRAMEEMPCALSTNHQLRPFQLGDRVVNIRSCGRVPFGWTGSIVSLYKEVAEVMFDEPFLCGTTLNHRCRDFRGAVVSLDSLLNLLTKDYVVIPSSSASAAKNTTSTSTTKHFTKKPAVKSSNPFDLLIE